ncbi:Lrp/AsnC family transcriptional regulator [Exilibacterium tricleocarpae]|uniref:Lrp/AsnC family transcriptional regulator n=1 Tax=Exilibacterium tricleocarpae TaxID=2591008 RepID=UPI001FE466DF|nr:Lrp/AsnC family transcriptional regulator [Exilibacterium tricleocarpae]
MTLDRYDGAILETLQTDGRLSNRELAERVGLSAAPCWRRVKRLEDEGYIQNYVAMLDPKKVGIQVLAFAEISLDNHHADTLAAFIEAVEQCPEILECHSVTGQCDYLLKIAARDMEAYEHFLSGRLLQVKGIRSVNTLFSLKQPKQTLTLPILTQPPQ